MLVTLSPLTASRSQAIGDSRFLNNQQEQQLFLHIRQLCDRCLPPTPAIQAEIAAQLGGRAPGHNWCSSFVERYKAELDPRSLNSLDLDRLQAGFVASFEQYFSIVGEKIKEYGILLSRSGSRIPSLLIMLEKAGKPGSGLTCASPFPCVCSSSSYRGGHEWMAPLSLHCSCISLI